MPLAWLKSSILLSSLFQTAFAARDASLRGPVPGVVEVMDLTARAAASTSAMAAATSRLATSTVSQIASASLVGAMGSSSTLAASMPTAIPVHDLPLTPQITPVESVAGIILISSGLIYGLVGTKRPWIPISISAAYLVMLAITVLILYIVNPPVSLAVQGAYLVAIVIPALLMGALATVFKDITELFSCAVGGFALSMFLLVLRPGGLLPTTTQKAIFIAFWTIGIYLLAFIRLFRYHLLLISTSIGGATAVMLGIDCFSRAGLKEFWLYIWDLNSGIFPAGTQSYPLNRGMCIEIAMIAISSIFGVLSQIKSWHVVRLQKERNDKAERDAETRFDLDEVERGLQVGAAAEACTQCEKSYGDTNKISSETQNHELLGDPGSILEYRNASGDFIAIYPRQLENTPRSVNVETAIEATAKDKPVLARNFPCQLSMQEEGTPQRETQLGLAEVDSKWPFSSINFIDGPPKGSLESTRKCRASGGSSFQASAGEPLLEKCEAVKTNNQGQCSTSTFEVTQADALSISLEISGPLDPKSSMDLTRLPTQKDGSLEALIDPSFYNEHFSIDEPFSVTDFTMEAVKTTETVQIEETLTIHTVAPRALSPDSTCLVSSDPPQLFPLASVSPDAIQPSGVLINPLLVNAPNDVEATRTEMPLDESPAPALLSDCNNIPSAACGACLKAPDVDDPKSTIPLFKAERETQPLSCTDVPSSSTLPPVPGEESEPTEDASSFIMSHLTAEPEPISLTRSENLSLQPIQFTPGGRPIPMFQVSLSHIPRRPASLPGDLSASWGISKRSDGCANLRISNLPRQPSRRGVHSLRGGIGPVLSSPISENEEMTFHSEINQRRTDSLRLGRTGMFKPRHLGAQPAYQEYAYSHSTNKSPSPPPTNQSIILVDQDPTSQMDVAYIEATQSLSARRHQLKQRQTLSSTYAPKRPTRGMTYPQPWPSTAPLWLQARNSSYSHPIPPFPQKQTPSRRSITDPTLHQKTVLSNWRASIAAEAAQQHAASPWTAGLSVPHNPPYYSARDHSRGRLVPNIQNGRARYNTREQPHALRDMGPRGRDVAHREVLRRMQAGANRRLRESETLV